jgi:myo-inositol-1(or 4)-monophosphatase
LRAADQSASDYGHIREVLAAASREGGELALKKFRSPFRTWTKGNASPVSEVDIAVDELLRDRLGSAFPDYGWLSEESVDDPARLNKQRVWIVDPIDGTRAFISGREDWVISAALVEAGRPIAGALYAPVADALYLAEQGRGMTLNGVATAPSTGADVAGARASGPQRLLDLLVKAGAHATPKVHSLALRLAHVATGVLDVAFAGRNSHDWDIAAADIIVREAGGELTTLDGAPVVYNRPSPVHEALVATGSARQAALLRLTKTAAF